MVQSDDSGCCEPTSTVQLTGFRCHQRKMTSRKLVVKIVVLLLLVVLVLEIVLATSKSFMKFEEFSLANYKSVR